jgi:ubiquinone/menaquinone biosynthesis C-methylase UbiE
VANQLVSLFRVITRLRGLPEAESKVLKRIEPTAGDKRMLDIGAGSGRTTSHFAPHFFEYVGIDADENAIRACRKRYAKTLDTGHFDVLDVRSMRKFRDATFDFILWSEGYDELSESDRALALREVRRVAKKGAQFLLAASAPPESQLAAAGFDQTEKLDSTYHFSTAI